MSTDAYRTEAAARKEEADKKEAGYRKEEEYKKKLNRKKINKTRVTFGVWGFVLGAIIAMFIGFKWGGWTTSGTSQQMTEDAVSASQAASQAAICVAQFIKDPKYNERLQELQQAGSGYGDKPKYIEEGGWDKMPGQQKAKFGVAKACAEGLELLAKK